MLEISINDIGVDELFKRMLRQNQNLESLTRDIAIFMKTKVLENFQSEGRSSKWKDLMPSTKKAKIRKKGTMYPILEGMTGKLKQSINIENDRATAKVFTGLNYGVYHQTGTRKMAQRAFMPTTEKDDIPPFDTNSMEIIRKIIEKNLEVKQ